MLDRVQPDQLDVEDAVTNALSDARVLRIVLTEANESPRLDTDGTAHIVVDQETFIAWMRACDHLLDSVRETARVFYGEPKP